MWVTPIVAVAGIAVLLVSRPAPGGLEGADQLGHGTAAPAKAYVRSVAMKPSIDGRSLLGQWDTAPFRMLGVTWVDPNARVDGAIEVRARDRETGTWSKWLPLDADPQVSSTTGPSRGGTDPLWVGPSNGVEVRITSPAGVSSSGLPEGLRLDMIDPGAGAEVAVQPAAYVAANPATTGPTDSASPADTATPTATPSTTSTSTDTSSPTTSSPAASPSSTVPPGQPSTVPKPPIVSRADWGADESISPEDPIYLPGGTVKAVVVHHTAGTNDYACAESPAIVRGIYTYHVRSRGFRDIGYNFLVDKCGIIFEGRKGGVDQPVMGAHTYGWNSETTGISVLGNLNEAASSTDTLTAVARIAAWKLGQYGGDASGTVGLTAGATQRNLAGRSFEAGTAYSFPQVFGHRDGVATECPGADLWADLPTIRTWAAGPVQGLAVTSLSGAGRSGSTYYTKGTVTVRWSATTPAQLISRYELLVDGNVAAAAGGAASSAQITLATGSHSLQVRAVHQSGRTATTEAQTVVTDTTTPTFTTKPRVSLRAGTVSTAAVPVRLAWKATDNAALRSVALTAPITATYGPAVTSTKLTARSGTATTWALRATDYAGNTSTPSAAATPVILQESSAVRSGTWTTRSSTGYLGGRSYSSSSKGASLTWTFTGRSAAWVVSGAPGSGQAHVYVDGTRVATVDLRSPTARYRHAIWTRTWSSSVKHRVKIVVVGTSGRPTVTTDGLVYIR